ncbi:MAG: diguanylate cyclase [Acinetobacter populi]|uniref:GGDEF domain-containing protein n=1 Tax=Acinetobacter populi TaxID=1582270 RepID=UPI0023556D02|nr:sensor domain-containing diguanylate cyclase [Acinetobacter populi]MCH4248748.1 diguanylate cyclase [Acinetobacter populi]
MQIPNHSVIMTIFVRSSRIISPFTLVMLRLVVIAVAIFIGALIGIWSRPSSFLAFFWPANALLLGLLLRFPSLQRIESIIGAVIGFFAADLLTGSNFPLTVGLTFANLVNVVTALFLMRFFHLHYKQYNHGLTFFYILILITISSALGAFAAISIVPYLPQSFMNSAYLFYEFILWWTGEMQNMVLFLPLILAFPTLKQFKNFYFSINTKIFKWANIVPIILVALSTLLAAIVDGPGTLAFPIAALIWAALRYNFFSLALINAIISVALFYNLNLLHPDVSINQYLSVTVSIRIGLLMLMISSLTVCLVSTNRRFLFKELLFLVEHDSLTKTMSRHHFMQSAQNLLNKSHELALLMIDIDHFKKINDLYGHQIGDLALQHFAQMTHSTLRDSDLFGRIGGEEFAILLDQTSSAQAELIALQLQDALTRHPLRLNDEQHITIELSIGLFHVENLSDIYHLDHLIHRADQALYQAKREGRNRICVIQQSESY